MIRWASQMGIVTGFQDGSFRPNENVTRVQLAAMLFRFAQYQSRDIQGRGDLNSYQDSSSVQAWAKEAIQWAVAKGLISGKSGARLDPSGSATRAEAARAGSLPASVVIRNDMTQQTANASALAVLYKLWMTFSAIFTKRPKKRKNCPLYPKNCHVGKTRYVLKFRSKKYRKLLKKEGVMRFENRVYCGNDAHHENLPRCSGIG